MNYDINNFPLDLVLNILGIVIIFIIVRLLVYKPAKKFLDARRERLNAERASADAEKQRALEMKASLEEKLSSSEEAAKAEARCIIDEAKTEAAGIIAEANERAEKVLSMAEAKIKAERESAKKASERETISMAFEIAEKILERRVNDSDTINMAQKLFDSMSSDK